MVPRHRAIGADDLRVNDNQYDVFLSWKVFDLAAALLFEAAASLAIMRNGVDCRAVQTTRLQPVDAPPTFYWAV
jgi:hypothetical protein